ncbi:hypothetical protein BBF96_03540 [Anoxybacter fermentans]|uniref:Uncharacterized protein n=1 Tax=Anoxybacter fermentans TaxID=1323375 RepID=A0A3Q9HP67_9FIRM|nr:hypothetical protein [Anoxybacter fermentans]AZR72536.1 hypothetical protein BBF96_03540 [Anoxybacter fermentans]
MLYKFLVHLTSGEQKEVIAENFMPANGSKVYFKIGQRYIAMYKEEQIDKIDFLGEYIPETTTETTTETTVDPQV